MSVPGSCDVRISLTAPTAYVETNVNCCTVIARHLDDKMYWNIAIPSEMQELLALYWLPYGARFIAASKTQENHYQGC